MTANSYDEVPYDSNPFPQSQPEQLAVIAKLFGLSPPLPSQARVLELGCSSGGNLIPLAARYPNSVFVGIDSSKVQVEVAERAISELGLANIQIRHQDIVELDESNTLFDYIICHGVYSWVAPDVQDAILHVINRHLAEHGVAYVSYNTYPGWKMREVVRDTMMYHTRHLSTPKEKLEQSRAILHFTQEISDERSAFGKLFREEAAMVHQAQDYYLFHDHLEAENRPCYFRDFIERAQAHELAFLGEATLADMAPQRLGRKVHAALQKLSGGNILATEQYMDFFRNRAFRQTLLVRSEAVTHVKRELSPQSLKDLLLSSTLVPLRPAAPESGEEVEFRDHRNRMMKTAVPLLKATLLSLAEAFPQPIAYQDCLASVREKLAGKVVLTECDFGWLNDNLMNLLLDGLVQLHVEPLFAGTATDARPRAFGPARLAAQREAKLTPNLRHEIVALNPVETRVLALLDGSSTVAQVCGSLIERTAKREITLMRDNIQLTDPNEISPIVDKLVMDSLRKFEKAALLAHGR